MTGRAAGFCAGYPVPGFMNPIPGGFGGRGFGRGRGRGWGRGFGGGRGRWLGGAPAYGAPYAGPFGSAAPYAYAAPAYGAPFGGPYAQPDPQQETDALKGQAEYLEDALEGIRKRLAELEAEQAEKK
jgi:hypothetical protein